MSPSRAVVAEGRRRSRELLLQVGSELRSARSTTGLSLRVASAPLACSPSTLSRLERGLISDVPLSLVVRYATVLGLASRLNLLPLGSPLRDAGQVRLLNRLRPRLAPSWRWIVEAPIGPNDLRAFDAAAMQPDCRVAIDAWSRIRDLQAQLRRSVRKFEDSGFDRLVLLFADTEHNRRALEDAGEVLTSAFPRSTRQVLAAFGSGCDPGGNGIVVL